MAEKLIVKSSPHMRDSITTTKVMGTVIIALMPALIASTILFGLRALLLVAVCVASCVAFEYLFRRLIRRDNSIGDLSAVVTGILIAFNLPATMPFWMAIVGCFFAIVVVKQLFGGLGQNFVNPAIAARVMLLISFATPMTTWLVPGMPDGQHIERVIGATPLTLMAQGKLTQIPNYFAMFLGIRGGSIGETCIVALLIGGIFLMVRKIITPTIPVVYLATVVVFAWLAGADPLFHLLNGGVVLGAFFMATDYVTSPVTEKGKYIYAIGCGLITMLIRLYGSYPEGTSFAILLMNIVAPHIDTLTRTHPFGGVKKK